MNPHDQHTRPAAHRVHEQLGVDDVWTLLRRHPEDSPEAGLAWHLASSATAVDGIHRELTATAKAAVAKLSPVAAGEHAGQSTYDGILRETGLRIDLLAARREAAFAQFAASLTAYARCTGADRKATSSERSRRQSTPQQALVGLGAWDDEQGVTRMALREVQLGDLWLRENGLGGKDVIRSNGLGTTVEAETVEPLIDAGLIAADTSTSCAGMGHMLSLTSAGHRALEVAHAARQRAAAASYRDRATAVASWGGGGGGGGGG
ncbi:hypothetical protein ACIQI7_15565, partial [Kitasatospora sp. NPDC092039]|uniref:hypothetical protein n=1 Tax=Kitasatospora sp. NPDC092039 TaxID=3364086 RepID=UPI003820B623